MSKEHTVSDVLKKLEATLSSRQNQNRQLNADTAVAAIDAILLEVDETVLPRRLVFSTTSGRELVVGVSGRRVLRVVSIAPESLLPDGVELFAKRDEDAADEQLRSLMSLFALVGSEPGDLSVRSDPPVESHDSDEIGYSVSELRKAANDFDFDQVDVADPADNSETPLTRLGTFAKSCGSLAVGRIRISLDGEITTETAAENVSWLRDFALLQLKTIEKQKADLAGAIADPELVIMSMHKSDDSSIAYASDDQEMIVLAFERSNITKIISAWVGGSDT